jgi:hypothetical protein
MTGLCLGIADIDQVRPGVGTASVREAWYAIAGLRARAAKWATLPPDGAKAPVTAFRVTRAALGADQ